MKYWVEPNGKVVEVGNKPDSSHGWHLMNKFDLPYNDYHLGFKRAYNEGWIRVIITRSAIMLHFSREKVSKNALKKVVNIISKAKRGWSPKGKVIWLDFSRAGIDAMAGN